MATPPRLPARRAADLAAAAWLELGLYAMRSGNIPAAFGAFAAINDADWDAIVRRFPHLPALIEKWSNPR